MIERTIDFIESACSAKVLNLGKRTFLGVSTDTRTIQAGELFVALVGPLYNGHTFLQTAIEKGASAVLVSEQLETTQYSDVSVLWVEDTLDALQKLAQAYLEEVNPKRIAVTGSTGKSSTKEIIHSVLSQKYKTFKNKGNLNNHIGLPLTILDMPEDTEILVVEMGMNHYGEIRTLCDIVKPDEAVITNIGDSHIEYFGSREGILRSKLEIAEKFDMSNTLWVNGEDHLLNQLTSTAFPIVYLGAGQTLFYSDYEATSLSTSRFKLHVAGDCQSVEMPLIGRHNASNALFAVAAGIQYGLSLVEIIDGIRSVGALKMRLQVKEAHGLLLVDDTYNASPDSVLSALDVLLELPAKRYILVFADILELGDLSASIHRSLGEKVDGLGLDYVYSYGVQSATFDQSLIQSNASHFDSEVGVISALTSYLQPGDAVLFKGSRGMHVDLVLNYVIERGIEHVVELG